jgi:hypothetical protein
MPVLSTRGRLREKFKGAAEDIEHALERLKRADEIAAGQHPRITEFMPDFVAGMVALKDALLKFRDEI